MQGPCIHQNMCLAPSLTPSKDASRNADVSLAPPPPSTAAMQRTKMQHLARFSAQGGVRLSARSVGHCCCFMQVSSSPRLLQSEASRHTYGVYSDWPEYIGLTRTYHVQFRLALSTLDEYGSACIRNKRAPGEICTPGRAPDATAERGGDLTAWRSSDSRRPNWKRLPL